MSHSTSDLAVSQYHNTYDISCLPPANANDLKVYAALVSPLFAPLLQNEITDFNLHGFSYYALEDVKSVPIWHQLRTMGRYILRAAHRQQYGDNFDNYPRSIPTDHLHEIQMDYPIFLQAELFKKRNPLKKFLPSIASCNAMYAEIKRNTFDAFAWIQIARYRSRQLEHSRWDWRDPEEIDSSLNFSSVTPSNQPLLPIEHHPSTSTSTSLTTQKKRKTRSHYRSSRDDAKRAYYRNKRQYNPRKDKKTSSRSVDVPME
ncbi:hypothetical protein BDQ17DRAFT_1327343 [Cyathus striatus]|nr:hypothetical protein BDQ17DRAFT_1327343 [Cyathus striatus]